MSKTGERLKKLRTEKGLSMDDLARSVGVPKSSVHRWEQGSVPLDQATSAHIARLAQALGTSVDYLRGNTEDPNRYAPADYVAHTADGRTYMIEAKTAQATVPTDTARLYCLDILALQNGFRIEYTAEGDVLLIKGAKMKQVTEAELLTVMDELTRMAGFSLRRLMGGES